MKTGSKLYKVFWSNGMLSSITDAILETATFVEENMAQGASVTTYLVNSQSRKSRVAKDYYYETADAAWKAFILELQEEITAQERQLAEHEIILNTCKTQLISIIKKHKASLKNRKK